jgi:D-amino-acid dehydrogenase
MHVAVLGAGVVGVTTAFSLARAGYRVSVFERLSEPALATSFANASQISPALSSPWAVPGIMTKAYGWMNQQFPPLVLGRVPDAAMMRFMWRMIRCARPDTYASSKRAMVELGEYSRDVLIDLRSQVRIDYRGKTAGTSVLFRDADQLSGYQREIDVLADMGVGGRLISVDELAEFEPNIAAKAAGIVGAAHLPGDETGDCRLFTLALAREAQALGVSFFFDSHIRGLMTNKERIESVRLSDNIVDVDAVVICLGVWSESLLRPLGVNLPIYPLKGYSLTIAADGDDVGPHSTVSDETYKIGVTNLGDRVRVGGTAELAGFDISKREARFAGLKHVVRNLFPRIPISAIENAERWTGLRPMTPDGPPIIGRLEHKNLFINAGHGTLGWTQACGAAQTIADLVDGVDPAIDVMPFSPTRYQRLNG